MASGKTLLKRLLLIGLLMGLLGTLVSGFMLWRIDSRIDYVSTHSDILPEERKLRIFLPSSYNHSPNQHYDILYTLDGERWRNSHLTMLIAELLPGVPDIILVAIDSEGMRMRDFGLDGAEPFEGYDGQTAGEAINFLAFLETELKPHINANYRTSGTDILAGHSMGGLFTTYAFVTKPALFDGYLAFSPTFPAAIGFVEAFEETLYETQQLDQFIHMNIGIEKLGGYRTLFEQAHAALAEESPAGLRSKVSYYPLIHGAVMIPGYIEGLSGFYSPKHQEN